MQKVIERLMTAEDNLQWSRSVIINIVKHFECVHDQLVFLEHQFEPDISKDIFSAPSLRDPRALRVIVAAIEEASQPESDFNLIDIIVRLNAAIELLERFFYSNRNLEENLHSIRESLQIGEMKKREMKKRRKKHPIARDVEP